jgi:O-antigen/teichoic acid export membrane protein
MSYSKKIAFNTIIQLIGRVTSTGISIVIIALLTRRLGVTGYGEYSIVFAYLGLYAVLADFGFFYMLVRKLSANEGDAIETSSNLITMRTVAAIVIYLIACLIIQFFPYTHSVKEAVLIGSIAFLATSLQNTIFGIFQVHYQMHWAVVTDNVGRIITLAFIYYFISTHFNLDLIILAYVFGNVSATLLLIYLARRLVKFRLAFNWDLWKSIFRESIYFAIAIVFSYLYFKIDALMLSVMKSATDVGIYAPGTKILDVILILPQMFIGTVLPLYSLYIANNDKRLKETVQKTFDILALAMAGVVGGIFALSGQIINFIAGKDYITTSTLSIYGHPMTAVTALSIIVFAAVFSFLGPTFVMLLISAGKQKMLVLPNIICLAFNVILNIIFIPKFSYIAAAGVTVATEVLIIIAMLYLTKREFGFLVSFNRLCRASLAGVMMVVTLHFINLPLLFMLIIGGTLYILFSLLFGAIRPEIFSILRKSNG